MRSTIISTLLFVLCPVVVSAQSLEGAWTVDEVIIGGGEDEGRHTSDVQPGLFFFTESHYSRMFVQGWEPRALFGEDPTDEERLAAYRPFTANAGRYEVQGSAITFTPSVAKGPNRMAPNPFTYEIEWDGDTFWLTSNVNDGEWQNRVHYVRVAESLEGVWLMDEVIVGGGDFEGRHTTDIQPAFWIYTKSHYSRQWVGGYEPRPVYEQGEATDEELLAVWRRFGANAGSYEVQGSTITYTPIVAKNPRAMTDNSYTVGLEWAGDGFWLTFDTAGGWQNRAHYVRVEN